FLRQAFHEPRIRSMYGAVDCAGIGTQCQHLGATEYHVLPYVYAEVVDAKGQPLGFGEDGDVLVTVLKKKRVGPIFRYALGDRARFVSRPCPCGSRSPILEVLGRGDRVVNVASAHVPLQAVENAVVAQRELTGAYQVRLTRDDVRDRMAIVAELQ